MTCRGATLVIGLIGWVAGAGPDKPPTPETGFQEEVPVKQATRLDWTFAAASLGPDAAKLPDSYDLTRQQYQLYVPPAYDASKAWPLVLIASPGDEPLGWRSWQKTCEDQGVIFCAPYGVGNNVAAGRRVRILLDALDDVRRRYHVDPDRTYLVGFGGGGRPACAVAFALSEFFGGVIVADEGISLNGLEYLRWRARDRLSVALIAPGKDHPLGPYFDDMGVRCKVWPDAKPSADGPASAQLAEVYGWLAADVDRRRTEARRVRVWRRRTKRTRTCSRPRWRWTRPGPNWRGRTAPTGRRRCWKASMRAGAAPSRPKRLAH